MAGFTKLLRENRNYRHMWTAQVVSEVGDHFNNIAVFSLALAHTGSGMVVAGVMLARAIPAVLAGPLAGVVLDRLDRKRVMIASDLIRAFVALGFIGTVYYKSSWLMYLLSGLLMFASPFFTSGRASILPTIASKEELHAANTLTQTTQWSNLVIGAFLGATSVTHFGFQWSFALNAFSFFYSAWSISRIRLRRGSFRVERRDLTDTEVVRPWREYAEGLRYIRATPLIFGIAMVNVGWATGGGAAQILFSLFGEIVFRRGPAGIGVIWGCAGIGLLVGGIIGHKLGPRLSFDNYKRAIVICYIVHGATYVLFSVMEAYWAALLFIALSRVAMAVSSVLNFAKLLRYVPDQYRGRVFATNESLTWAVMMISLAAAGIASEHVSPRLIGVWSGILSSSTALMWGYLNWTGRLPHPDEEVLETQEVELCGQARH